jgi:hypothetical protein
VFDPTSRYAHLDTAEHELPDGRKVRYVRRRFLPDPATFEVLGEHRVVLGDRLDNITYHGLGDPERFWQLCDGNGAMAPHELEEIGRSVRITLPTPDGRPA